jgi:hypothetical protein
MEIVSIENLHPFVRPTPPGGSHLLGIDVNPDGGR